MRHPERNDIDISQLFKWNKEVEVMDAITGQKATFYLRLIGDNDLGRARAYALRKAGELRRNLKTEDSDDRLAYMTEIGEFADKSTRVRAIIVLLTEDINRQAIRNVEVKEPKAPPTEAPFEQYEEYQAELDTWNDKFMAQFGKEVDKIVKKTEKDLSEKSEEDLYKYYEALVIDKLCSAEMNKRFYDMCVYNAVYADPQFKRKAFKSFEEFDNAAVPLKSKLVDEYKKLEIGTEQLKKSQEAADSEVSGSTTNI